MHLTWRPEQISPYASIWDILHKLCRWNHMHSSDVLRLLAIRGCPLDLKRSSDSDTLIDPTWLDRLELKRLLNFDDGCLAHAFLEFYTCVGEPPMAINGLQFCPDCLGRGYHSALHNLPFVEVCPLHRRPLLNRCVKCVRQICYTLPKKDPFCCPCGHPLGAGTSWLPLTAKEIQPFQEVATCINLLKKGRFGPVSENLAEPSLTSASSIAPRVYAVYDKIRTTVGRHVAAQGEFRQTSNRRSVAHPVAALYAWRCFWEGDNTGIAAAPEKVPTVVSARLLEVFPASLEQLTEALMERLLTAACRGIFAEIWETDLGICNLKEAERLAAKVKGKHIPFWLCRPHGFPLERVPAELGRFELKYPVSTFFT